MPSTDQKRHYTAAEWSSYADSELPASLRAEMRAHLAECAECAALARSYDAVQRGAAELARRAAPPPPALRSRIVTIGTALMELEQMRFFWLTVISLGVFAVVVLGGVWIALRDDTPPPHLQPVSPESPRQKIQFALDRIAIESLMTTSMYYDVTIENQSDLLLEIYSFKVRDPFGEIERQFEPPIPVPAGTRLSRHGYPIRHHLPEDEQLRDGKYQITIMTNLGSFSAERVIYGREKK